MWMDLFLQINLTYTLAFKTAIQHCAGYSSQSNSQEKEKLSILKRMKFLFTDAMSLPIENLKESTEKPYWNNKQIQQIVGYTRPPQKIQLGFKKRTINNLKRKLRE